MSFDKQLKMELKERYDAKENEDNFHETEKISNFLIFYVNGKMVSWKFN